MMYWILLRYIHFVYSYDIIETNNSKVTFPQDNTIHILTSTEARKPYLNALFHYYIPVRLQNIKASPVLKEIYFKL